jgi:hypothetical protein
MAADFVSVDLNTNEFAEVITYRPGGSGGVVINAVFVERDGDEVRDERGGRSDQRYADLWIAQDAVNGVVAPTSSDTIKTAAPASEDWNVDGPPQDDGGAWLLQLVRPVVLSRTPSGVIGERF